MLRRRCTERPYFLQVVGFKGLILLEFTVGFRVRVRGSVEGSGFRGRVKSLGFSGRVKGLRFGLGF